MPCRVGITTNPSARKTFWENKVVGLRRWQILSKHFSREVAQQKEDRVAREHGCNASPGGSAASGVWYVYHFYYIRTK